MVKLREFLPPQALAVSWCTQVRHAHREQQPHIQAGLTLVYGCSKCRSPVALAVAVDPR